MVFFSFPVPERIGAAYRGGMAENRRTNYRISEAARELGISAEWLRVGERRGFLPPALRDRNGHRYYTDEDIERMRKGRSRRRPEPDHG
jgi:MerR HTH family regulatory protein